MMLTHLDLFSGIGGFALAARWAGFETIQFVEYEPYARKVLAKNFPDVPIAGDIFGFDATKYMGVGLLTGGFPCQPFSVAGKQLGKEDDRAIWPEMFRVIREARPTWVLGENVSGIIKMELDNVLSDLEGEGYTTQTVIVPACATDARHRRDRVWIVAYSERNSERSAHRNDSRISSRGWEEQNICERNQVGCNTGNGSKDVSDSNSKRGCLWETNREDAEDVRESSRREEHRQWLPEPSVGRVAHGIPSRVDRLRGLGNAIVPQVAYEIMRLMKWEMKNERLQD